MKEDNHGNPKSAVNDGILLAILPLLGWLLTGCHPHFSCMLTADTLPSNAVEIIQRYRRAQIDADLKSLAL